MIHLRSIVSCRVLKVINLIKILCIDLTFDICSSINKGLHYKSIEEYGMIIFQRCDCAKSNMKNRAAETGKTPKPKSIV